MKAPDGAPMPNDELSRGSYPATHEHRRQLRILRLQVRVNEELLRLVNGNGRITLSNHRLKRKGRKTPTETTTYNE